MFKKLTIRNFQKWRKLTIKFDPFVTIIVGRNDAGKSAIIRALRWVTLNKAPFGFRRKGTDSNYVELGIDNHTLRRSAGKGGNTYILDGKRFKVVGRSIPTAVSCLANLSEINFQRQHDSSFWFNLSPGQVAKELNKLVDLETIDSIQTSVAKKLRDKKSELSVCQKRLAEAKANIRQLSWVGPFNVKLGKLDAAYRRTIVKSNQLGRIRSLASLATEYDVRQRAATAGHQRAHSIATASSKNARLVSRLARLATLQRATASAQRAIRLRLPDTDSIEQILKKRKRLTKRLYHIKSLFRLLKEKEKSLCQCHQRIKKREAKLEDSLGGRCPVCGGILTTQMMIY